MLEAQVDAAPVNVGAFQFRHIEIPLAKVCQEWKPKGGGATNVYVAYEVRTYVTVRVEIPGDDIGFGKHRRLFTASFLTGLRCSHDVYVSTVECDEELKVTTVSPGTIFD